MAEATGRFYMSLCGLAGKIRCDLEPVLVEGDRKLVISRKEVVGFALGNGGPAWLPKLADTLYLKRRKVTP